MFDLRFSAWALVFFFPFLPVATSTAAAQQTPNKFTVKKIVFKGEMPYGVAALEDASGVKPGDTITTDGLGEAAQRLVDTGVFGDVGATVDGNIKAVDLIFTVKPADDDHILKASFDNFLWFTHEELAAGIQKQVPLFNGTLPDGGNLQEKVEKALNGMLADRGVTATISHKVMEPRPGRPFRMVEYAVTKPDIRVNKVDISGIPAALAASHAKVVSTLVGHSYYDGLYGGTSDSILETFRNLGYINATLSDLKTSVVSSTDGQLDVDITGTLTAGEVYRVTKLEWAGSPLMSAVDFTAATKLHAGDVASQRALRASLENLSAAYENQGYMDVIVDAAPTTDDSTHEVAYAVTAVSGVQYKLRDITVVGLSAEQRKDFDAAWKMMPGEVYNIGYMADILKKVSEQASFRGMVGTYKTMRQYEDRVCDVLFTFVPVPGIR